MTSISTPAILGGLKAGTGLKRAAAFKASVAAVSFCFFATGVFAGEKAPLRLCADPDNLPFSSNRADNPGIYREIGEAIAKELKRPLTEVWYRTNFGKRATRVTLLAKQCDLSIGLPADSDFMGPAVIFSKPFMQAGYALVLKKPATLPSLSELSGKGVAVQFNSTPHHFLANHDNIRVVTQMSPEEVVKAVASGEADAAFVWAPTAGYLNKTVYDDAFTIIPISGQGMQWPVAVAFAKRDTALRDAVDSALERISGTIADLKVKYGFPAGEPVALAEKPAPVNESAKTSDQEPASGNSTGQAAAETPAPSESAEQSAPEDPAPAKRSEQAALEASPDSKSDGGPAAAPDASQPAVESAAQPAVENAALTPPPAPALPASDEERVREGKEVFNGTCAHCHGPDAVQAERKIDLRLLHHRYKDTMEEMFFKTVTNGRPSKGMPPWKEVFTQDQFVAILAYLKTVQAD